MALYAFDGTWQKDEIDDEKDTNVSRFLAAYNEPGVANHYAAGVGTKWGAIGKIFGGAALALDFANEVSKGAAAAEGREQSVLVSGGSGVGICDSTIFGHIVKSCISATSLMASADATADNFSMAEPYVLVVEDDRLVREMLVRWLRSLGYQSTAVETAENALLAIDRERPMAVISDVMMPVHDGLWLLEEIHTRWPSLPVVMSSGATLDNEWLHRARRLGAVDFMAKPFARETLYQTLARVISPNGPLE